MNIISSFVYSINLELAITSLENIGIEKENIFAIPLDKRDEKRNLYDSINRSDGISLFDASVITGTIFMCLGIIYGFVLKWGPVIWGLIGFFSGGLLGFIIDIISKGKNKFKNKNGLKGKTMSENKISGTVTEVFVIIACDKTQGEMVEKILWDNMALGVTKLE